MKGVILAGGMGTRLNPLTLVTNKHLLPVYDKPMIFYPIKTLIDGGIKEIMIVCGPEHAGHFMNLLRSGKDFGVKFTYEIQDTASGIAGALALTEDFARGDSITVVLGDNIFEDKFNLTDFESGARIFLKVVSDPQRFGVAETDGNKVVNIIEKPKEPKSNYAVTGLYQYDNTVFDMIRNLSPSERGEFEITDVNNEFLKKNALTYSLIRGLWSDAGTIESLHYASTMVKKLTIK
jgi:glucose-1-phosphate thymidylyltransferase